MGGFHNQNQNPRGLIVGNYCHDVLIKDDVVLAETLGGAVSFISPVLDALKIPSDYVSKVGYDFAYAIDTNHAPIVSQSEKTTLFHAYFTSDPSEIRRQDRILKRIQSCEPISPSDLPQHTKFDFGMAVGVAGEISPQTLEKMVDICDVVFVDVQALIRVFDEVDGTAKLVHLNETGFCHLLPRIGFLKASAEEAPFVDVDEARKWCCVVVTSGKDGCTLFWKDEELQISPFSAVQVDPTGAGDSFLGGFVAGLMQGLMIPDAALLGNFFGSLTVAQIGIPEFDSRLLQRVNDEVERRKTQCDRHVDDEEVKLRKPMDHQHFITSLGATTRPTSPKPSAQLHHTRQILFLTKTLCEEPIESTETNP